MDWKIGNELNEVWQQKNWTLRSKTYDFGQKHEIQILVKNIIFLRKMRKVKNFHVLVPMDWKLSNQLNEVGNSSIWLLVFL